MTSHNAYLQDSHQTAPTISPSHTLVGLLYTRYTIRVCPTTDLHLIHTMESDPTLLCQLQHMLRLRVAPGYDMLQSRVCAVPFQQSTHIRWATHDHRQLSWSVRAKGRDAYTEKSMHTDLLPRKCTVPCKHTIYIVHTYV